MSFPHHADQPDREQSRLIRKLQEQKEGSVQREWPDGRINGQDDGELAFKIGANPEGTLVVLDFGKPVAWAAMPPQQAVELAQMLIRHARSISVEPLRIVIN